AIILATVRVDAVAVVALLPAFGRTVPPHLPFARARVPVAPPGGPGGSQVSPRVTEGSPHGRNRPLFPQPSGSTPLPSSHCSPASTWPSPHTVQSFRHRLPLLPAGCPGMPHVMPQFGQTTPLPHMEIVQLVGQPSQ